MSRKKGAWSVVLRGVLCCALIFGLSTTAAAKTSNVSGSSGNWTLTDAESGATYNLTYKYSGVASTSQSEISTEGATVDAPVSGNTITVSATSSIKTSTKVLWWTTTYYAASVTNTVTVTNSSGVDLKITELGISGDCSVNGITVNDTLEKNATFTITITATPNSDTDDKPRTNSATVTIGVTKAAADIQATFLPVSQINGQVPGSYTVTSGGTAIPLGETQQTTASTEYTMTATANTGFTFDGWYVNGTRVSTANPYTGSFKNEANDVTARFDSSDPMAAIAMLNSSDVEGNPVNSTLTKYDFITSNSAYYHKDTGHSYHTKTIEGQKDGVTTESFADPDWTRNGETIKSETSGTATGDYYSGFGEQSKAYVHIYSDVIRMKAERDCNIAFTCTISGSDTSSFYYYVSSTALTGDVAGQVIKSGVSSSSGRTVTPALSKGQYLYILAYGTSSKTSYGGTATLNYSFTATISNVVVTPLNTRLKVTADFRDNTGLALGAGKLKIGDTVYSINSSGTIASDYTAVAGASITMSVSSVPTGYVLVGWQDVTAGTTSYSSTYTFSITESKVIHVLFAPVMTVTASGSNGYESATYQYKNLSGATVAANGQYVARKADSTAFYATLNEAYAATDVVVLLAGDTFKGDFTVPRGKTLVVPRSIDDTAPTTPVELNASTGMTYYATVTMDGTWNIDGALMVSAQQAGASQGRPGGPGGKLVLGESSHLNVKGSLYAFGYVSGGSISVQATGTVHEFMEVKDMRNVTATGNIYNDRASKKVFPFNTYFIKNIEAPVTYASGASLVAHIGVKIPGADDITYTNIPVIGPSGAMFNLTGGTLTKSYDAAKDQTILKVDAGGTVSTGTCTFNMVYNAPLIGETEINLNTSDYYMPLCYGFNIQVDGNFTLNNLYKLLPGASLSVSEGGKMTIPQNSELVVYRMNDYDHRATGTSYQGYAGAAYPQTSYRFPNATYPRTYTAATVGSARLNVDGTLEVLGSLYSSNDTENGAAKYSDNGYNYLTGTGTIIMNSAQQKSSSIQEAMQISTSNDISYDTVNLTAISGLTNYAATADDHGDITDGQTDYTPFTKAKWYGYINGSGINVWSTSEPVTLSYDANGGSGEAPAPARIPAGIELTVAENPFTHSGGKEFGGWNTVADGNGTAHASGGTITVTGDTTLYAQWNAVSIVIGENVTKYTTLAKAVAAYNGTGYIQMIANSTESNFTLSKNLTLDLNGKTVNATVTIADGCILNGVDSSTNGFKNAATDNPLGKITVTVSGTPNTGKVDTVTNLNGKDYVAYTADDDNADSKTYSFHRFAITPNAYQFYFNPNGHSHLVFEAIAQGDSTVCSLVKDLGFTVTADNSASTTGKITTTTNWYSTDMKNENGEKAALPDTFAAEKIVSFAAVQFNDTTSFDVEYTVVAIADFSDNQDNQSALISSAAEAPNEESHKITFRSALEQYLAYLVGQTSLNDEQTHAKEVITSFLKPSNQS